MTVQTLTRLEADVACNLSVSINQAIKLCDELSDLGINTYEEFDNVLFYCAGTSANPKRDFVEFILEDVESIEIPNWLSVDYDTTWESNLRHDYTMISDGETSYFLFNQ